MKRGPASDLLRDSIRSDMEARVERIAARLGTEAPDLQGTDELLGVLEGALHDDTDIVAESLLARIREAVPTPL
ncbi:MAG: hypothetical protein R6X22_09785 [Gemmatimonadota bacterium]